MTKKKTTTLIIYTILFYSIWAAFEFIGKDFLGGCISNEILLQITKSWIIKDLVWTIPAICLVLHFKSKVLITLKEMFTTKVKLLRYLPIFLIFTVYIIADVIIQNGNLKLSNDFGITAVISLITVGLTEEMVFRGWLLNATIGEKHKWVPVLINSVMFLAVHFPVWIHNGHFTEAFTGGSFICVIILSIIFSVTFIKSRNILIPISLHMYWDLLMFMFFGP